MSDSRLEKFIYAICSMDVSDLPVPLSRIEKLWNCLITGEIPDFEPFSRNEKYLMAMLDRYDISNLPAPMSRGEKLLYKIAVGETDLSDVPGYLSRYEELLKYLIENGGISGGDFEYVLHTLNQSLSTLYTTAEKPVKSAILKGNTLVNVRKTISMIASDIPEIRLDTSLMKANTKYSVFVTGVPNDRQWAIVPYVPYTNNQNATFVTSENLETQLKFYISLGNVMTKEEIERVNITIVEGDVPLEMHFEGVQSVKMPVLTTTGKNLFDGHLELGNIEASNGTNVNSSTRKRSVNYIPVNGNTTYCVSNDKSCEVAIRTYDKNKNYINSLGVATTFTPPADCKFIRIVVVTVEEVKIQVEQGSIATSYEPYKSNILTVNEPVELRGIGDVRDTLDCLTGEVTERIKEVVFDGSENWKLHSSNKYFWLDNKNAFNASGTNIIADKVKILGGSANFPQVPQFDDNINTAESFKQWLSQNPITVQYQLATESIKTVDLTVVDQDNQPTQLGTFENVTHVSLESAGLIPEVEMEVATNLLEDTVFNLTDAFNTLYPTAAKPVVDGTLYGQTLVNCLKPQSGNYSDYQISSTYKDLTLFKPNTLYTFINNWDKGGTLAIRNNNGQITNVDFTKNSSTLFTTPSTIANVEIYSPNGIHSGTPSDCEKWKTAFIVIEGDYTNVDIPYFEGMQSVKMPVLTTTGKNLFKSLEWEPGFITSATGAESNHNQYIRTKNYIDIQPNMTYTATGYMEYFMFYDSDKNFIRGTKGATSKKSTTFTTPSNARYLKLRYFLSAIPTLEAMLNTENMLELGEQSTGKYEPYKSNILTTPSDLELRKVGGVQDELNVMTGEVVERIDEFVLIGNEYWDIVNDTFRSSIIKDKVIKLETQADRDKIVISCDRYPSRTYNDPWTTGIGNFISLTVGKAIVIKDSSFTTVEEWKEYLSQNPLVIKFVLATPTTKTVDISVVNQDGNSTTLKTFDDTTHVLLNSEGLIPTASLTVRTKIPSGSSTSLLMDDISDEQKQLNTMIDEQSNNVDATMVATTEIFEETL